jgi:agmatine deiminase
MSRTVFPAEWYPQSGVQLTWPHAGTDWFDMLDEVTACYVAIASTCNTPGMMGSSGKCPRK